MPHLGSCADPVAEVLGRRLAPASAAPLAVAFSGGGDSLAALLAAKAWADRHGRRVLALSVDHGLQPQSADWLDFAASTARRIGADFQPLRWTGLKPDHGLPAAARAARHRLIAEAAREAGARVVVFGHTADDLIEADRMRAEGLRLGTPREWSPAPVWPEGRGLFLLRPLLAVRRAAIREALKAAGETWIDDPANNDPRSPRARARSAIGPEDTAPPSARDDAVLAALAQDAELSPAGFARLGRERLRLAPASAARRLLAAAALCVGGGAQPPRGERLERLYQRAVESAPFQATLSGSKIIGAADLLIVRDAGEARRGGLAPIDLKAGSPVVWDGRFEAKATQAGLNLCAAAGAIARLDTSQRRMLRTLPAAARPGLPVLIREAAPPVCPILASIDEVSIVSLVPARFLAGCGAILKEPAT